MLRIGLTGGIGAGKSTVSSTFTQCGAVVVDGDLIAREVVEPGTEGLAARVDAFGAEILLPAGALNRPARAAGAFGDDDKRATLPGIVPPLVARRRSELIAAAAEDAVIVEDIPLLVESQMAPLFPLVIVVDADVETRVARLVAHRGMPESDARARIAAQATEDQRRAVADVWLDNSGSPGVLTEATRELWYRRIVPFAHNVHDRRIVRPDYRLVAPDPTWGEQSGRILARLRTTCGHRAVRVDHIGSTAVPGMDAKDIIDVQVTVSAPEVAEELADDLLAAGYPRVESVVADEAKPDARSTVAAFDHVNDPSVWHKRFHASADPGRPTHVHIRVDGRPTQQFALLFVDWLAANPGMQSDYLALKRRADTAAGGEAAHYIAAKEPWFLDAYRRAWAWADAVSWRP